MLRLFGIESTSELQLVYHDVRDSRDSVYKSLQRIKPEYFDKEHLRKIKEKNLQKIIHECKRWNSLNWKEAEELTPRFFERIEVHPGYQLDYKTVPEIQQFLPVVHCLEGIADE